MFKMSEGWGFKGKIMCLQCQMDKVSKAKSKKQIKHISEEGKKKKKPGPGCLRDLFLLKIWFRFR